MEKEIQAILKHTERYSTSLMKNECRIKLLWADTKQTTMGSCFSEGRWRG